MSIDDPWERVPTDDPGRMSAWIERQVQDALNTLRPELEADRELNLSPDDVSRALEAARPLVRDKAWENWLPFYSGPAQ